MCNILSAGLFMRRLAIFKIVLAIISLLWYISYI